MHTYILLFILVLATDLSAVSMVYNFRIAQITKQPISKDQTPKDNRIIALVFNQYRKKYTGHVQQNYAGALGSYLYDFGANYARVDFGFGNIHEKVQKRTAYSGTDADDILLTLGRNVIHSDRAKMTFSGLFGFPTHKLYRLQRVDFGYSQIGIGLQLDGSYSVTSQDDIFYGARYIRFISRHAYDVQCNKYTFSIGNIADLLCAYQKSWLSHSFELGYTNRYRFGASVCPNFDDVIRKTNYIRSNFYGAYSKRFKTNYLSHKIIIYSSYGFDHKSKIYGNKIIFTVWTSWTIGF